MIVLHHLEKSRSHRVLWLLEELNLDYRIEVYRRNPKTMLAPKSLREVHPLGKSPVLTMDSETLAESGAILEYLAETHPGSGLGIAPGEPGRRDYLYWLHYAEGSLMSLLVMSLVFSRMPRFPMPFFMRPVAKKLSQGVVGSFIKPQVDTHLSFIEHYLTGREWLAGDRLSTADIQMSYPLEALAAHLDLRRHYPRIHAYLERLRQRPAYRAALEKGGPLTASAGK